MQIRIAFGCQFRVGKDTAAEYLQGKTGGTLLNFAEPIRKIEAFTQATLGLVGKKDRKFRQTIGDWGRSEDEDIFVKLLVAELAGLHHETIYVTDVRFPNEFAALKKAGFYMVRLTRRDRPMPDDPALAEHPSERSLCDAHWDETISNDGTLDELHAKLDDFLARQQQYHR